MRVRPPPPVLDKISKNIGGNEFQATDCRFGIIQGTTVKALKTPRAGVVTLDCTTSSHRVNCGFWLISLLPLIVAVVFVATPDRPSESSVASSLSQRTSCAHRIENGRSRRIVRCCFLLSLQITHAQQSLFPAATPSVRTREVIAFCVSWFCRCVFDESRQQSPWQQNRPRSENRRDHRLLQFLEAQQQYWLSHRNSNSTESVFRFR